MFFKCVQKSKGSKENFHLILGSVKYLIAFHKAVTGLADEKRPVDIV